MKNIKKILACIMAVATLGSLTVMPMGANAIAKLLGYYPDGTEIYGGIYDTLVGFDENGKPIIETKIPEGQDVIPDVGVVVGDSEETPVLGDSIQKADLNETPTGIRGDVNYDGEVDAIDLLLLKKYILQIITW